jgi:hypothetical protein
MLRAGPVIFLAMLVGAAGLVPFAATAGPELTEQLDPVVVTLPSRALVRRVTQLWGRCRNLRLPARRRTNSAA